MSNFFRVVGIFVISLVIIGIGVFFWLSKSISTHTEYATPFVEEAVPKITSWNLNKFEHLLTNSTLVLFQSKKGEKTLRFLSKVGALVSFEEPKIVKTSKVSNTENGTRNLVIFQVVAHFVKGEGLLTITLVENNKNYLIESIYLNSDSLLD